MSWGHERNIHKDSLFIKGDILDKEVLDRVCKDHHIDAVFHCAASLEVTLSQDLPTEDLKINTEGTINVLEAMRKNDIERLVNFSSACIYGFGTVGMEAKTEELKNIAPQWGYGSSKIAAEIYADQYARTFGFCVSHFRPGIISGPREWYGRVLTIFLNRALKDQDLVIFGDGRQERDFTHVHDLCRLVVKEFQDRKPVAGSAHYNGGTSVATSIKSLAERVAKKLSVPIVCEDIPEGAYSKNVKDRIRLPFEMQSMRLDMTRAEKELGFIAENNLDQIIDDEVEWLKATGLMDSWDQRYKV